ncbi:MAG: lipid-A-disaccharide synthase [Halioglobus sp.]|nr:lipid-A-disaccharide synthase [Halioglobus sp.]
MRIGVLAGEPSGDILGARVLAALRMRFPNLEIEGIGGPLMEQQGLDSMFPMDRLSVMGFIEPLKRLPELLRIRSAVREHFSRKPPDIFLGIDSPDFNLRLEEQLRARGVTTAHLVSPSVWAWRQRRIHRIKRAVDLMLCLFPFETAIYRQHDVPVCYVGHPLADEIPTQADRIAARSALGLQPGARLLALLPGSREGEVRLLAPLFLRAASLLRRTDPTLRFVLPAVSAARRTELEPLVAAYPQLDITVVTGRSREVMAASDAVLLASGTATLEAALLKRPMVVAYRMGALSWLLLKLMVKTPYAALPNILAGRALVPELLQERATPEAMAAALEPLLSGSEAASGQLREFTLIHDALRQDFGERAAAALAALVDRSADGG